MKKCHTNTRTRRLYPQIFDGTISSESWKQWRHCDSHFPFHSVCVCVFAHDICVPLGKIVNMTKDKTMYKYSISNKDRSKLRKGEKIIIITPTTTTITKFIDDRMEYSRHYVVCMGAPLWLAKKTNFHSFFFFILFIHRMGCKCFPPNEQIIRFSLYSRVPYEWSILVYPLKKEKGTKHMHIQVIFNLCNKWKFTFMLVRCTHSSGVQASMQAIRSLFLNVL